MQQAAHQQHGADAASDFRAQDPSAPKQQGGNRHSTPPTDRPNERSGFAGPRLFMPSR